MPSSFMENRYSISDTYHSIHTKQKHQTTSKLLIFFNTFLKVKIDGESFVTEHGKINKEKKTNFL